MSVAGAAQKQGGGSEQRRPCPVYICRGHNVQTKLYHSMELRAWAVGSGSAQQAVLSAGAPRQSAHSSVPLNSIEQGQCEKFDRAVDKLLWSLLIICPKPGCGRPLPKLRECCTVHRTVGLLLCPVRTCPTLTLVVALTLVDCDCDG